MKLLLLSILTLSTIFSTHAWETKSNTSYSGPNGCRDCSSGKTELSGTSAVAMKAEKKNNEIEQITRALEGQEVEFSQDISNALENLIDGGVSYEEALLEVLTQIIEE